MNTYFSPTFLPLLHCYMRRGVLGRMRTTKTMSIKSIPLGSISFPSHHIFCSYVCPVNMNTWKIAWDTGGIVWPTIKRTPKIC